MSYSIVDDLLCQTLFENIDYRSPNKTDEDSINEVIDRINILINFLSTFEGKKKYVSAFKINMHNKQIRYNELVIERQTQVKREKAIVTAKKNQLKDDAGAEQGDSWLIFEKIGETYIGMLDDLKSFEQLEAAAIENQKGWPERDYSSSPKVTQYINDFIDALENLKLYKKQFKILLKVISIVDTFIKAPDVLQYQFINFMLTGAAGTGKTTLVKAIARVFSAAGMFIYDDVRECGRGEFIGQYMGQTVAKTKSYLATSLDCGVVFIDEAYALTNWENGHPESYGSEATSAMVEFMTKYKGLYCIFTAGYEMEMYRYFLPTNPGLSRRFPHKSEMVDYNPVDLVEIMQYNLCKELAIPKPTKEEGKRRFTQKAWNYLQKLIEYSMEKRPMTEGEKAAPLVEDSKTKQKYPPVIQLYTKTHMYKLFENQAGSMTNLAEEAILSLLDTVEHQSIKYNDTMETVVYNLKQQGVEKMKELIKTRIENMSLSSTSYDSFIKEFEEINESIGIKDASDYEFEESEMKSPQKGRPATRIRPTQIQKLGFDSIS